MTDIVQKDNPVLREKSRPLEISEIDSPEIQEIISRMKVALSHEPHGVAIAAPQIGQPLRVFVVSGKIFQSKENPSPQDLVYINPFLENLSKTTALLPEGCLSVKGFEGTIERATKVTLSALNERGTKLTVDAEGLLAQIFQHEVDHLNGILYTDHAQEVHPLEEESSR